MPSFSVRCRDCKNQIPTENDKFCRCEANPRKMTSNDVGIYIRRQVSELTKKENALHLEIERCEKRISKLKEEYDSVKKNISSLDTTFRLLEKDGVI